MDTFTTRRWSSILEIYFLDILVFAAAVKERRRNLKCFFFLGFRAKEEHIWLHWIAGCVCMEAGVELYKCFSQMMEKMMKLNERMIRPQALTWFSLPT